ncbi:hypothetical protein Haur_4795 [Herpetosiphon aurantiacus DSM 785]|uniref:DUF1330 domain-containing protein n=3 Tax=Herpetosiphonaceae TaxID=189773 RepID=A9B276_HERA2|nr:hypothetical protein Haur_4795 [Herpetosiphon aurantiacus DSM 785]
MIKLLMSWNIAEGREQAHLEYVTSEFVPALMKHGAISDAWLSLGGTPEAPEMILGITSDEEIELRSFMQSNEWQELSAKLSRHVADFRYWFTNKIQNPGGFQM